MLAAAYNYGTLSKVRELINFYKRLVQSLPHALAQAEEHRLKFVHPAATTLDDFAAVAARLPTAFRKEDRAWRIAQHCAGAQVLLTLATAAAELIHVPSGMAGSAAQQP